MRLNRRENTKRNVIIGEIDKITGILLPFAIRTMIIHRIGADYLGLTSLFYSILQMLNLVEMGFGTAILYSIYQPIAEDDQILINALLHYYRKIYAICGTLVLGLGLALMPFLPRLIRGSVPRDINLYGLYLIYLTNTCINFFVFPNCKAILTAYQRDDLYGRIHIFTQLGMYLFQAFAIWMAGDYYLYAVAMPVSSLIYSLLCAVRAHRQFPECKSSGTVPARMRQGIRKQVAGLMIRKLAMLSRNAFDSMFVSAFLGLTLTAVYANYYYIMDSVIMILAVLKTSMAGGVGNSIALDSVEKNRTDFHKINFLFMWISGWCAVCLLCLYQPFMRLWVGDEMTLSMGIAVMFAVYFYVLKMSDIRMLYSEAAGIWWQARFISIGEAAANLLLNYFLTRTLGLYGILLATMLSYFVFNVLGGAWILYRHYFTQGGFEQFLLTHLYYAVTTVLAGGLTWVAVQKLPFEGIAGLLATGLVCCILPNLVFWLCYQKCREFAAGRQLVLSLFGRLR